MRDRRPSTVSRPSSTASKRNSNSTQSGTISLARNPPELHTKASLHADGTETQCLTLLKIYLLLSCIKCCSQSHNYQMAQTDFSACNKTNSPEGRNSAFFPSISFESQIENLNMRTFLPLQSHATESSPWHTANFFPRSKSHKEKWDRKRRLKYQTSNLQFWLSHYKFFVLRKSELWNGPLKFYQNIKSCHSSIEWLNPSRSEIPQRTKMNSRII